MVYNTSQPPAEQREEKVMEGSKDSSREEVFQTIKLGGVKRFLTGGGIPNYKVRRGQKIPHGRRYSKL
jgi:hypothetical protein